MNGGTQRSRGRVLIGKPGLDGHTRGAKFIAKALADHGYEVIYTGIRRTPAEIATAAVQEDVDVVGLSLLSGAHNTLFPQVLAELRKLGAADVPVIAGGVIPQADIPGLLTAGITAVFTPGAPIEQILAAFDEACTRRRKMS
ncbi:MAG: cobalamin B12-binding domain-containing protein [Opitutaceae bacterium]|nr:cobalamin B12-binding domain-containing protein [Opitutaceae bacterium]